VDHFVLSSQGKQIVRLYNKLVQPPNAHTMTVFGFVCEDCRLTFLQSPDPDPDDSRMFEQHENMNENRKVLMLCAQMSCSNCWNLFEKETGVLHNH
jgi:hypothetical protein